MAPQSHQQLPLDEQIGGGNGRIEGGVSLGAYKLINSATS